MVQVSSGGGQMMQQRKDLPHGVLSIMIQNILSLPKKSL